jgi:hypothetical protein
LKSFAAVFFLVLMPVFTAYNSCSAFNAANKKVENNTDNSIVTNNGNSDIEYVTLPNGVMVEAGIPEDIVDMIFKRIEAIEDGDLAAFRSTLGEMQDGVDYYYQLGLIYNFFGDFFDIAPDVFDDAVATGSEELPGIAYMLFNGDFPVKSRNTGLIIKKLDIRSGLGLVVTVKNKKNEEIVYNFLYY